MKKHFVREDDLILDAFRLGRVIYESGFRPSFIVGLWRGGSSVGIYVQECLQTLGVKTDHIALRTSYHGRVAYQSSLQDPAAGIRVHGTQYLVESLNQQDSLLIVDDVFSSGRSSQAVIDKLSGYLKRNMPDQVKVAAVWRRPGMHLPGVRPDYWVHETADWLVMPYELAGLTAEELEDHKHYVLPWIDQSRFTG